MKRNEHPASPSLGPIVTLVLWLTTLAVGVLGFALPYPQEPVPKKEVPSVKATLLNVELTQHPIPPVVQPTPPKLSEPPPLIDPVVEPAAPPMLTVAAPSPAITFALPVDAPARVVDASQASYKRPTTPPPPTPAAKPQTLVFGEGDGKQPAPEYPDRSRREGQEGRVIIRFSVDENGRVHEAQIATRCPWPALNNSALRAVAETWRFPAGPWRLYEVPIKFQLNRN